MIDQKEENWLMEFIKERVAVYREPETTRGPTSGFSKQKYTVSFFCALSNLRQERIAKSAGITHGLLRKWRTEPKFKTLEDDHLEHFVNFFVERIEFLRSKEGAWFVAVPMVTKILQNFVKLNSVARERVIEFLTHNFAHFVLYQNIAKAMAFQNQIIKAKNQKRIESLEKDLDLVFAEIRFNMVQWTLISLSGDLEDRKITRKRTHEIADELLRIAATAAMDWVKAEAKYTPMARAKAAKP
jgi:hypothetical protein